MYVCMYVGICFLNPFSFVTCVNFGFVYALSVI
jgi:hypothetical protein